MSDRDELVGLWEPTCAHGYAYTDSTVADWCPKCTKGGHDMSERTTKKQVEIKTICGSCDGEGYEYYCDDNLDGMCISGWDLPCNDCKGTGITTTKFTKPDPKWAKMWRDMNRECAT